MRGMAAEVAGKDATAKKTEAEVEHVRVETDLKAREAAALKQAEAQDFGMEWEKKLREIGDGVDEDEGESEDNGGQAQELS
jgi:hypothetical protein